MAVLVGREAPDFTAAAVSAEGKIVESFNLKKAIDSKYGLVFFYPLNFTFVCPTELIALDHKIDEFQKRGVVVIGVSIDSQFTHNAWRNTSVNKGGIGSVRYVLVADTKHDICRSYGVEHVDAGVALRAAFLIDKKGIVRSQIVNDLPLGRNIEEILRLFDALHFHEQHGEVCPANWKKGEAGMQATCQGVANYLSENAERL